ncbi:MAG: DUF4173 domain-containing protein [Planctomycetales bacterium]|nr:DUF4173 domain-containing protein [Planctomycetales bacterium]
MSTSTEHTDDPVSIVRPEQPSRMELESVPDRRLLFDLVLVALWVAATDWLIYRLNTYTSWAIFFALATILFGTISCWRQRIRFSALLATLLFAVAVKLIWCGSGLQVACGILLSVVLAMYAAGMQPFLPELASAVFCVFLGGVNRVSRYALFRRKSSRTNGLSRIGVAFLLPIFLVFAFASIFVLANPELADQALERWHSGIAALQNLITHMEPTQLLFWTASAWILIGLLYPALLKTFPERDEQISSSQPAMMYSAYRNSLFSLVSLFAIYLVFEFATLWGREFPEDFYYAGYAHQGAFWLTVALAMTTALLCIIFRGSTLADPRLKRLKWLAMFWAIENFVLALAVYHRLFIYIEFNGMTRMRVIGLLGTSCVVAGLIWALIKIRNSRGFVWLLHRQAWVPAVAVIIYAILPVDWLVHRYNVWSVQSGKPAAVVQIVAHPSSAEGMLPLFELIDATNPIMRDGIRAMLALWAQELQLDDDIESTTQAWRREQRWRSPYEHTTPWIGLPEGFSGRSANVQEERWYQVQLAESQLHKQLNEHRSKWIEFAQSPARRDKAIDDFYRFAYQWY